MKRGLLVIVFPARLLQGQGGLVGLAEYLHERATERVQLWSFLRLAGVDGEAVGQEALERVVPKLRALFGAAQDGVELKVTAVELAALRVAAVPVGMPPVGAFWPMVETLRPLFDLKGGR